MVKLALPLGREPELGRSLVLIDVDKRTSQQAFARLDEPVLLYRYVPKVMLHFIGKGRVVGLHLGRDGSRQAAIGHYTAFISPISDGAAFAEPGASRLLSLSEERYEEIMQLAELPMTTVEAAEQAARFASEERTSPEIYVAVYDQVLRAWDYRCALTGVQFNPAGRPHPKLHVVAIRARDRGGPLHVRNFLPMVGNLVKPWRLGHLTISPDHRMWADLSRLDPEVQNMLRPEFRLLLPENPDDWPDPELLAWHRLNVFSQN